MLGKAYGSQTCSIARTLEVIGERWSPLIVRDALFGRATRYRDFQRSLGIATNVLTARLDGLVEAGILRRHRYSGQPGPYAYVLTEKGRALAPVLVALGAWGDRWATDQDLHPLRVRCCDRAAHGVCPLRQAGRSGGDRRSRPGLRGAVA